MAFDPEVILQMLAANALTKRRPPRRRPPDTRGLPTVDGRPRVPIFGEGIPRYPVLPIYKNKPARWS